MPRGHRQPYDASAGFSATRGSGSLARSRIHHGQPRLDRAPLDADQAAEPAVLEDRDGDAERSADRGQVRDGRLERDH
jgi:hypothetical protein